MDLAEAEAIRDLIDAQTVGSARQAIRQLRGELSQQLKPLKEDLLNVIVILESALEFVEEIQKRPKRNIGNCRRLAVIRQSQTSWRIPSPTNVKRNRMPSGAP